jgi:hypothetical protein
MTEDAPFADLPAALVDELLGKTAAVGERLLSTFREIKSGRESLRKALYDGDLVVHESTLGYPPLPTTCGTDGSYAIERLLTVDLAVAAAVAVEGLTPPSEKRHWERPYHSSYVSAEVHHSETATVLRAVMLGRELQLAARAPHDLVMIDMTLTLPVIYFNQALNMAPETPSLRCAKEFLDNCVDFLGAYETLLRAERTDKNYVALPKYSTRREIGLKAGWPGEHDDRGLLTLLLKPGELTRPLPLQRPERGQEWHLNTRLVQGGVKNSVDQLVPRIIQQMSGIHVFYYKAHDWLPALRVEVGHDIAVNSHRLASVVQGLKHQCATAAMLEPYPLYLADRTVKALAKAVPAFRQVTTQRISESYEGEIGEVYFAMHGYRSEIGG